MLSYHSTRNSSLKVTSAQAIVDGIAADGGLYVPDDISALSLDYKSLIREDYLGMARMVFGQFFPDFDAEKISDIVTNSYRGRFTSPEITPLAESGGCHVLELYHGPTAAFKDIALSALPNLMAEAMRLNRVKDEIMILTATSGDTGSAALNGFADVPGTKIIVFYPEGGVSDTQRLQMVTAPGDNVTACAVRGNFDDAQTGVKEIFGRIEHPAEGVSLSSANSINIGRLVPQVVYYFSAYRQLVEGGAIEAGDMVNYSVPTGNFGDIMAGYFARAMGLPVGRLICASNKNDVLTEFLETGRYNSRRNFYKTASPSMDILVSSNLERLLYFVSGEERVREYMSGLAENGEYTVSADELEEIREVFAGVKCDEEDCAEVIGRVYGTEHYLMDTHTAVARKACEEYGRSGAGDAGNVTVVLSTASPYKFSRAVLEAVGAEPSAGDRENMRLLEEVTGVEIPKQLAAVFEREVRHSDVIEVDEMQRYVIEKSK